jgi:hypothetical protein
MSTSTYGSVGQSLAYVITGRKTPAMIADEVREIADAILQGRGTPMTVHSLQTRTYCGQLVSTCGKVLEAKEAQLARSGIATTCPACARIDAEDLEAIAAIVADDATEDAR